MRIFLLYLLFLSISCSGLRFDHNIRYISHPYEFEKCGNGEKCILVKGTFILDRVINIIDRKNLVLDGSGSILIMNKKAPVRNGYSILNFRNCSNIDIANFKLDGNRDFRGCSEQYAHSVILTQCRSMNIANMEIIKSPVDAIYISAGIDGDSSTYCRQINISNVYIDSSCRNGISIINGFGIKITDSEINNSKGLSPAAGIDIESDAHLPVPTNKDITIESCKFSGHGGCGIMTSQKGVPENIFILNNQVSDCEIGIFVSSRLTEVANNQVVNCKLYGIQSVRYDNLPIDANRILNNNIQRAEMGIHYCGEGGFIASNYISDCDKAGIWLNGNTVNNTSVTVSENRISNIQQFGIRSNNFASVDIKLNNILSIKQEGLSIVNGNSTADSNYIQFCSSAAVITGSRCEFKNNEVMDCDTGFSAIGGGRFNLEGTLRKNKFTRVKKAWLGDVHLFVRQDNTETR